YSIQLQHPGFCLGPSSVISFLPAFFHYDSSPLHRPACEKLYRICFYCIILSIRSVLSLAHPCRHLSRRFVPDRFHSKTGQGTISTPTSLAISRFRRHADATWTS